MGELLAAKPRLVVVLAVLAICAGLVLGLAREAIADYTFKCSAATPCARGTYNIVDADGRVPEGAGHPETSQIDGIIGKTYTYYVFGRIQRNILYDADEMRIRCANSYQWNELYAHERAHSRGWDHGMGPAYKNDAYNRVIYLGPC